MAFIRNYIQTIRVVTSPLEAHSKSRSNVLLYIHIYLKR